VAEPVPQIPDGIESVKRVFKENNFLQLKRAPAPYGEWDFETT
jgi:hypothetical protein